MGSGHQEASERTSHNHSPSKSTLVCLDGLVTFDDERSSFWRYEDEFVANRPNYTTKLVSTDTTSSVTTSIKPVCGPIKYSSTLCTVRLDPDR